MARVKTAEEVQAMREGGAILSRALKAAVDSIRPGITLRELDEIAEKSMRSEGAEPSFKGYGDKDNPFPSTVCISVNDEIVHGLGNRDLPLKEGDIVGLDIGCWYKGLCTDMAVTVPVGEVSEEAKKLMSVTRESLLKGVAQAKSGVSIASIGKAVEEFVKPHGYGIVRALVGHGVGHAVHEPPSVPNFYDPKMENLIIEENECLALEPMLGMGEHYVETAEDGWSIRMSDGKLGAHFEVTIVCTKEGAEILTPMVA